MKRILISLPQGLLAAALLISPGCGGAQAPPVSSSTDQAQVKGKVTLNGKAVDKAQVKFNPANVNRKTAQTVVAETKEDGSYEITTLVGENTVTVGGRALAKKPQSQYFAKSFDVQAGSNSLDIDLR